MRIGIFGGTFNPPHKAHLNIAREFNRALNLDRLMIIPDYTPPHKNAPNLAPGEDRLKMCRILFEPEGFTVSDREMRRKGKSYTVDTLSELRCEYPEGEFFLLIGSDMLYSFHQWRKFEEILKMCTLCVAFREESDNKEEILRYAYKVLRLGKDEIEILNLPALEVSSTQVRSSGEKERAGLLTKEVNEYIKEHGLYENV